MTNNHRPLTPTRNPRYLNPVKPGDYQFWLALCAGLSAFSDLTFFGSFRMSHAFLTHWLRQLTHVFVQSIIYSCFSTHLFLFICMSLSNENWGFNRLVFLWVGISHFDLVEHPIYYATNLPRESRKIPRGFKKKKLYVFCEGQWLH